jgi:outer membrane protein assembly factor BamB
LLKMRSNLIIMMVIVAAILFGVMMVINESQKRNAGPVFTPSITDTATKLCWSTYQHDFQRTGYSADEAPRNNDTLWINQDVHGSFASPIAADGKVFLYAGGITYALDALTGSTLWEVSSSIGVQPELTYFDGSIIEGLRGGGIEIVDVATGNSSFIDASNVFSTGGGAPIVDDKGIVYFGENNLRKPSPDYPDSAFFAYDLKSQTKLWEFSLADEQIAWSAAASADGQIIVFTARRGLHALNMSDGQPMWTFSTPSGGGLSGASASGDLFFAMGGDGTIYAVNRFDGTVVWKTRIASLISHVYTPAVGGGKVFAGSDEAVYALDAEDGRILWTSDVGETVASGLSVSGGLVFVGSDSGGFYALDEEDGGVVWILLRPIKHVTPRASAAVCNGIIFINSEEGVRAVGTKP